VSKFAIKNQIGSVPFFFLRLSIRWSMKNGFEECQICGTNEQLTFDHIIPRSWGSKSSNELDNLCILCLPCNMRKNNNYMKLNSLVDVPPNLVGTLVSDLEQGTNTLLGEIAKLERINTRDNKQIYRVQFTGENPLYEIMDGLEKRCSDSKAGTYSFLNNVSIALDPRYCMV